MTASAFVKTTDVEPDLGPENRASGRILALIWARQAWVALKFLVVMTVLTGVVYPLLVLGIGTLVAGHQADGTLMRDRSGAVVGSALIGQQFSGDQWFLPRPSAAGQGYDAMSSGGSNLAADSPKLADAVNQARNAIARSDGVRPDQVPADAVTASGSGLDPNISPAYAQIQINRVAGARHLPVATVSALVAAHTELPWLGFLGQARVNVLELNLALSALS